MSQTTKVRALILGKVRYGESDLIIRLLTNEGESISAIAKSALKSRKRFGGGALEPLQFVEVTLRRPQAESEKMAVLQESMVVEDFIKLRSNYDRLEVALHFLKVVNLIAREGDRSKELFDLLGHALKAAEVREDLFILKIQFDAKLLHLQGVLPPDGEWLPLLRSSVRDPSLPQMPPDALHRIRQSVDYYFNSYLN